MNIYFPNQTVPSGSNSTVKSSKECNFSSQQSLKCQNSNRHIVTIPPLWDWPTTRSNGPLPRYIFMPSCRPQQDLSISTTKTYLYHALFIDQVSNVHNSSKWSMTPYIFTPSCSTLQDLHNITQKSWGHHTRFQDEIKIVQNLLEWTKTPIYFYCIVYNSSRPFDWHH
jgi:hypothetical protein